MKFDNPNLKILLLLSKCDLCLNRKNIEEELEKLIENKFNQLKKLQKKNEFSQLYPGYNFVSSRSHENFFEVYNFILLDYI